MVPLVYSPNYNITACGLQHLHPFDSVKYRRIHDELVRQGLRRAGDLTTAAKLAGGRIVIHNAGERFTLNGPSLINVKRTKLSAPEIVALLHNRTP